jgi:hypothetical protein
MPTIVNKTFEEIALGDMTAAERRFSAAAELLYAVALWRDPTILRPEIKMISGAVT